MEHFNISTVKNSREVVAISHLSFVLVVSGCCPELVADTHAQKDKEQVSVSHLLAVNNFVIRVTSLTFPVVGLSKLLAFVYKM
jgi:hypothetical protein